MHIVKVLFNDFKARCQSIHKTRLTSLFDTVQGLTVGKKLSLVGLGRDIETNSTQKHQIKRVDRLLGNKCLYKERILIYKALAARHLKQSKQPLILVDWSSITPGKKYHILRASIPFYGRSITIFEEIHTEKKLGNPKVEKDFLHTLKKILPGTCRPIIITDAGYRNPWFKTILALGWNFVGRVRKSPSMQLGDNTPWLKCRDVYAWATNRVKFLGSGSLAKGNPVDGFFYLYKGIKKNRKSLNKFGKVRKSSESRNHAKAQKEPWLLFSSLGKEHQGLGVISLYRKRMQIEEGFRDIKNERNGFSMNESRTKGIQRLSILLLIGMIATYVLTALGIYGKFKDMDRSMQTNSVRHRNVLSLLFVGFQILKKRPKIPKNELKILLNFAPLVRWEFKIC